MTIFKYFLSACFGSDIVLYANHGQRAFAVAALVILYLRIVLCTKAVDE